jgi:hypothetical protein
MEMRQGWSAGQLVWLCPARFGYPHPLPATLNTTTLYQGVGPIIIDLSEMINR